MKICHMTSVHQSTDIRIFVKECCSLAANNNEVYLVAKGDSRDDGNVKVVGVGEPPSGRLARMFSFSRSVYKKALSLDCEVYHIHDPELLPYAVKLARKGKKVIFDSHEDVPSQILDKNYLPKAVKWCVSKLYKKYETYAVRRISAVVAATPHIGNQFRGRARKIAVVNNFPKLDDIVFQDGPFEDRDRIVCYAGGINELRGEKVMLAAMKNVKGTLLIAGEHQKELLDLNADSESMVEYLGKLDRAGINDLYAKAVVGLCLLQPANNYFDAQPIKMYEYMAAGIPFVCSDFPKWRKLIDRTNAGICVNPEDAAEVSSAITFLLKNRDIGQKMGKAGRKAVVKRFNWSVELDKLLELYRCI